MSTRRIKFESPYWEPVSSCFTQDPLFSVKPSLIVSPTPSTLALPMLDLRGNILPGFALTETAPDPPLML